MRFFEDYETNERAKALTNGIELVFAALDLDTGNGYQFSEDDINQMKRLIEERPVILAGDLAEMNGDTLYKIQNVVGCDNNVFKSLSDSAAMASIVILSLPINMAKLELKIPVIENSPKGTKLRGMLHGSTKILIHIKKYYYLTDMVEKQRADLMDLIDDIVHN